MTVTIPRAALEYFTNETNAISEQAKAAMQNVLDSIEWSQDAEEIAENRDFVIAASEIILPIYTNLSAQAAADFYDAVRELAVGEVLGAQAISDYNQEATNAAIRSFVDKVVKGSAELFASLMLDRVDYEIKVASNTSIIRNAELDPLKPRYARVPTGAETCEFCIMLASRGFVYRSEETAKHAHSNCDCRVVPGFTGTQVEGYDADVYYELYRKNEDLKQDGVPESQRKAILAAMKDRLMPQYSIPSSELVGLYEGGFRSAWTRFKQLGKTDDSYQKTIGIYLREIGEAVGGDFSAEFMARPEGEEIWAATKLSTRYKSIVFRYASSSQKNPDFLLNGELAELKTPRTLDKVKRRTSEISGQFTPYQGEPVFGIISTLYIEDSDATYKNVEPFVRDGTLDKILIVTPSEIIDV